MSGLFMDNNGNRDWKKVGYHARSAFAVLLSLAVLFGGGWFVYDKAKTAYVSYKTSDDYAEGAGVKDVLITIPEGSLGGDIGDLLVANKVVKSRKAFLKAYAKNEKAKTIQAGTYKLKTEIAADDAVDMLLNPANQVHNRVTVPEALWMSTQFAVLSKKTGIPVAQFQAAAKNPQALGLPKWVGSNPEGFFFPQTYEIGQKPTATSILKLMAKQFNEVAARNELVSKAEGLKRTPMEIITVASILEAEAKEKDQPIVAGIIYNRLEDGMQLQLDSTSYYATKTPLGKPLPKGFREQDSPYNTYKAAGLPPGPIGAPGEKAIKAALNPTNSEYKYWLTVNYKTGETKFAKTFEEHEKNRLQWEAWCKTAKDKSGCPA
ncbi:MULTISPECIES: endolytic transglycosylase MltG [unclassified Luteococcus]|uniref:endolytic transglycosylase MltG n=1 Tax=unclassified Luteococcus TaxID=2639923 RepID=UPI00313D148C